MFLRYLLSHSTSLPERLLSSILGEVCHLMINQVYYHLFLLYHERCTQSSITHYLLFRVLSYSLFFKDSLNNFLEVAFLFYLIISREVALQLCQPKESQFVSGLSVLFIYYILFNFLKRREQSGRSVESQVNLVLKC